MLVKIRWLVTFSVARRGGLDSDTTNFIIKIVFVVLAIAILYILIQRHPGFIDWLKGLGGVLKTGAADVNDSVAIRQQG